MGSEETDDSRILCAVLKDKNERDELNWTSLSSGTKIELFEEGSWDVDYLCIHGKANELLSDSNVLQHVLCKQSGRILNVCYKDSCRSSLGYFCYVFAKSGDCFFGYLEQGESNNYADEETTDKKARSEELRNEINRKLDGQNNQISENRELVAWKSFSTVPTPLSAWFASLG